MPFQDLQTLGRDRLVERVEDWTSEIERMTPVEYNQATRYLPQSAGRFPGYIDYSLTPYWVEILECFDISSSVREVAVKKGVQIAYTTALESVIFYLAGHLRTVPSMFATADNDLANARMENNIIPMFQQSGLEIFQSADIDNSRKTGKTKNHLQWIGGGYLIPKGAHNADKMRMFSILYMLMDEIDAWQDLLKGGGDPIRLFKDRCAGFWEIRKIMMGSTPLLKGSSHIDKQFRRGDQRRYNCRCLKCGYPQHLRWSGHDKETGDAWGFAWDYTEDGSLDLESVRYHCKDCNHAHQEHDKPKFFAADNAFWKPTATPQEPNIRSYHIPALLSPAGMQPWYKSVSTYLEAMDLKTKRVKDIGALQIFYNNVLGESFEVMGAKVNFIMVSGHRRSFYLKGAIPNAQISQHCQSEILFLTCTVDVHKGNLAITVWGWTAGMVCWLIDYQRIWDDSETGCEDLESPAWGELQKLIDDKEWIADDGKKYRLALTFIDASWSTPTVVDFCKQWQSGVYPIMGRERPSKAQSIKEFAEFRTQAGTIGYRILVDHYKDRIAPALRRDWRPEQGTQPDYQFNAPLDTTDAELKELTREYRREKLHPNGTVTYYWHRPHGADNELWDLMVYGHASVEVMAWMVCVQHFQEETVDWPRFWDYVREYHPYYTL
jgi:phage terminase large subunit GpA-like protein